MTKILYLSSMDNEFGDHCVGWAKRSVPNIKAEKLLAGHPNGIFIRWARYALPNLRENAPVFGSGLSGLG